jgi:hypothetical protein
MKLHPASGRDVYQGISVDVEDEREIRRPRGTLKRY